MMSGVGLGSRFPEAGCSHYAARLCTLAAVWPDPGVRHDWALLPVPALPKFVASSRVAAPIDVVLILDTAKGLRINFLSETISFIPRMASEFEYIVGVDLEV